ncbi:MAG TPA: hypothetical protein PLW93_02300, partial [Candidatus Absconditabacterales bacterium]|nr:hypothetical protein [Candidatus Absconditabacterales bacterium]
KRTKEKFDSVKLLKLYLTDIESGRAYLYNNIGYFISRARVVGIEKRDKYDIRSHLMLFIDKKIQDQIVRRNIVGYDLKTANTLTSYIVYCVWGHLLYKLQHQYKQNIDTVDLSEEDLDKQIDSDHAVDFEYEWIIGKILLNSDFTEDERSVILLYLLGYSKYEIIKNSKRKRVFTDATIEKLKLVVINYLDDDNRRTIEGKVGDYKSKGDRTGEIP